jgi:DNA (cytosine-5)-methyltransferase 1
MVRSRAFGGGNCSGSIDVAASLAAHGVWQDFEVETFVAQPLLAKANSSHDDSKETYIVTRDVAATLTRGAESSGKGGYAGRRQEDDDNLVAHSLRGEGFDASEDGTGRGTPIVTVQPMTLAIRGRNDEPDLEYRQDRTANAVLTPNGGRAGIGVGAVAFQSKASRSNSMNPATVAPTLDKGKSDGLAVATEWAVRRLTPTECERLQGFPDGFTNIPWRGKPEAPDGPRYKALGNSMAVNVMRWIGRRIEAVDAIECREAAA